MLQRYADVVHYIINIKQLANTIKLKECFIYNALRGILQCGS